MRLKKGKTQNGTSAKILQICETIIDQIHSSITSSTPERAENHETTKERGPAEATESTETKVKLWNDDASIVDILGKITNIIVKIEAYDQPSQTEELTDEDINLAMEFCKNRATAKSKANEPKEANEEKRKEKGKERGKENGRSGEI